MKGKLTRKIPNRLSGCDVVIVGVSFIYPDVSDFKSIRHAIKVFLPVWRKIGGHPPPLSNRRLASRWVQKDNLNKVNDQQTGESKYLWYYNYICHIEQNVFPGVDPLICSPASHWSFTITGKFSRVRPVHLCRYPHSKSLHSSIKIDPNDRFTRSAVVWGVVVPLPAMCPPIHHDLGGDWGSLVFQRPSPRGP